MCVLGFQESFFIYIYRVKGRIRSCGFLRFLTYKDDELFQVRLCKGLLNAQQGQIPRQGLEIGEKLCENTKKPGTSASYFDPRILIRDGNPSKKSVNFGFFADLYVADLDPDSVDSQGCGFRFLIKPWILRILIIFFCNPCNQYCKLEALNKRTSGCPRQQGLKSFSLCSQIEIQLNITYN